jgi:hypothetical protein
MGLTKPAQTDFYQKDIIALPPEHNCGYDFEGEGGN